MTAAEDRREELEAFLWQHVAPAFADRRLGAALVAKVMDLSDACVKAVRPPRAPKSPAGPEKPPAVHYAIAPRGNPACRPGDWLPPANWAVTADAQAVTCGHCRKTPAWQEAAR